MLAIARDVGGTIRVRAPRRPDASPTVAVYNASGGAVIAAATAATLDSVNTTLNGAHAAAVSSLTVVATTDVVAGDEYALGARPTDFVRIKSVDSATAVTLQHPTIHAYATGVAVQGTYISRAISAAVANVSERDWRAEFSWAVSAASQPPLIVRFDVSRYAPAYGTPILTGSPYPTMNDIRTYDPKVTTRCADTFDYEWGIQRAVNEVLRDLSANRDGSALIHDDDYRDLAALKFLASIAGPTWGPDFADTREMWRERYDERFRVLSSQMVADEDQNRAITENERGAWGGFAYRA